MPEPYSRTRLPAAKFAAILAISAIAFGLPPRLIAGAREPATLEQRPYSNMDTNNPGPFGRLNITRKLQEIKLTKMPGTFGDDLEIGLPLSAVLRSLKGISITNDPQRVGVNFIYNPRIGGSPEERAAVDAAVGVAPPAADATAMAAPPAMDADKIQIKINPALDNLSLKELLDAICLVADHPITYAIEDYGVVFFVKPPELDSLQMRTFHVDPVFFAQNLTKSDFGPTFSNLVGFFAAEGINLTENSIRDGSFCLFNPHTGDILARATPAGLEVVKRVFELLNIPPPQVRIDVKFVSVDQTDSKGLNFGWFSGTNPLTGSIAAC